MQRHLNKDPSVAHEKITGHHKEELESTANRERQAVGKQPIAAGRHSEEQVRNCQHPKCGAGDRQRETYH